MVNVANGHRAGKLAGVWPHHNVWCRLDGEHRMPMLAALLLAAAVPPELPAELPPELPLDGASLARLPVASATLTAHGRTSQCDGVWLSDLAVAAGLPAGEALRGPALTIAIIAEAADGYRAAFTLAEIDPKLGNRRVLITGRCDNAPLASDDGPLRLVVPGEARAARSVRQLQRLKIHKIQ
jgi:hypothetical protein